MPNVRNTKVKAWVFTLNNYSDADLTILRGACDAGKCTYVIFGREVAPETGTPHLQGFAVFVNRIRLAGAKKLLPSAHWEAKSKRSSVSECITYCEKDGDFEAFGTPPVGQGHRSDLLAIQRELQAGTSMSRVADQYFIQWVQYRRSFEEYANLQVQRRTQPPKVIVLEGETGVGKTRFAYEYGSRTGGVWISNDSTLSWYDGYAGQATAVLDDFDGKGARFRDILRITDRYPVDVPIKGGFTKWIPSTIFITTNASVEDWFPDANVAPLRRRVDWFRMREGEYDFDGLLARFGLE